MDLRVRALQPRSETAVLVEGQHGRSCHDIGDTGCRQPNIKQTIREAATEGANGMRFCLPTSWRLTHPNLAAATWAMAKIVISSAKTSAQSRPTHKKLTVRILTSPPPIKFRA